MHLSYIFPCHNGKHILKFYVIEALNVAAWPKENTVNQVTFVGIYCVQPEAWHWIYLPQGYSESVNIHMVSAMHLTALLYVRGGKKPTRAVRLEAIWLFFTTDILTSVVVNHQGNMKTQSTNSNTVWEVGRYLITSQNTTLHQFQVSKGGWGVREGRGSVGNANQRLTKNIQNTKRIKLY